MTDVSEWWFGWDPSITRARIQYDDAKGKLKALCDWAREFGFEDGDEMEIDDDLREWFEIAMGEDEGEEE